MKSHYIPICSTPPEAAIHTLYSCNFVISHVASSRSQSLQEKQDNVHRLQTQNRSHNKDGVSTYQMIWPTMHRNNAFQKTTIFWFYRFWFCMSYIPDLFITLKTLFLGILTGTASRLSVLKHCDVSSSYLSTFIQWNLKLIFQLVLQAPKSERTDLAWESIPTKQSVTYNNFFFGLQWCFLSLNVGVLRSLFNV